MGEANGHPGGHRRVLAAALLALAAAGPGQADVACVQEVLALHGYDPGPVDGQLGPRTRNMAQGFAIDWRLDLPALTGATSQTWCSALRAVQRGAGQPLDPALVETEAPPPGTEVCRAAPPDGYAREITGLVDGDPVTLRVSARFGGAVDSLTWRGQEFLNIYDHGRQISYAWHLDDHGECLNPTEPGAAADGFAQASTTEVLAICSDGPGRVSTRVRPAFWLAPGETGFCDNGTVAAVNRTTVSDNLFEKTIEIGYGGIENVIAFTATITLERDYRSLRTEMPTAYLGHAFTARYSFDPRSGALLPRESQRLVDPWSFVHSSELPPVLATEDGAFALGAYTAETAAAYQMMHYDVPNPFDATNKWNIRVSEVPAPAGADTYRSFAILGTLEEVRRAMVALAAMHPTDLRPAEGYVDVADCAAIDGWAWDPDAPGTPVRVDVVRLGADGSREVVASRPAERYRPDLQRVLRDDGRHGFNFRTARLFPEGGPVTFTVEAQGLPEGAGAVALIPSVFSLDCRF